MRTLDDAWRKSKRSNNNGSCVEARYVGDAAEVRDTKDRQGPVLTFSPQAWTAFVDGLKSGR
jgi:hypothetical protein